ncbi:MAG: glycosyltransferase [Gemmatimonadaceae bacterium]
MENLIGSPRVLHILAPAREGGAERVVAMLAAEQGARHAHVAAVLSPEEADDHPFVSGLVKQGVPVTRVIVRGRSYLREYRLLSQLVARLRPAVVHTHGYRPDLIGGLVARAHGARAVSTVHGFTGGGRKNEFNEWVQQLALRRADAVIAVSRQIVARLRNAGLDPARLRWIPNGFTASEDPLTRSNARNLLGIPSDVPVIGWVGRLSREKGPDVMLDAFAQCDPSWQLSIVGDGRERDRLLEQASALGIAQRVTWHGLVPNAGALLKAFDVFVLSSRTEGTPIALLEAMHAGVPIVATRVGGVPDVVSEEEAILVPPEQPATIAQAVAEIHRDLSAAAKRCVRARERVARSFGVAAWVAAVDRVYLNADRTSGSPSINSI